MAFFETGTVVRLAPREAITLPDTRGATLRVTRGTLWITQERRRDDVVLRAGDDWVVECAGDTVVEAQGEATFSITGARHLAPIGAPAGGPANPGAVSRVLDRVVRWLDAPPQRSLPYV
ncbi:MAG: DUF2917 domain-containing protein [Candidatus Levyibacteriota bacterium]